MDSKAKTGLVIALIVIVFAGLGLWWFFSDDAPAEADLAATASSLVENSTTIAGSDDTTGENGADTGEPTDVSGTWSVDNTSGDFDYESATGTFAGIRIKEELARVGSTTAVGRTGAVSGTVVIDGTTVNSAEIEVDMSSITTNDGRRDNKLHEAIESGTFPTATFVLTEPIELPEQALSGEAVTVTATGDLTVHGVTNQIELDIEAQLVGDTIVMTGSAQVTFSDYDVEVPSSPIVLSVDDVGTLELQLLLTRD